MDSKETTAKNREWLISQFPIIKCDIQTLGSHGHPYNHYVACDCLAHYGTYVFPLPNFISPVLTLPVWLTFSFSPPGSEGGY